MEAEEFKDRLAKTHRRDLLALFDSYVRFMDKDRHALHRARFMEVLLAVKPEAEEKEDRLHEQRQMLTFDARYPLFDADNNFVGWSDASNGLAQCGYVIPSVVLAPHGIDWKEEQKRLAENAKFEAEALAATQAEMAAPAMMVQVKFAGPKPGEPNRNGDVFSEELCREIEGDVNRLISEADVKAAIEKAVAATPLSSSVKQVADAAKLKDSPLFDEALFQKSLKRAAEGRGHTTQKECDEEDAKNLAAFVCVRPQDSRDSDYLCDICGDIIAKGGHIKVVDGKKCHSSCAELGKPAPTMLERLLGETDNSADAPTIIPKPPE